MPNFNTSLYKTLHQFQLPDGKSPTYITEPISGKIYGILYGTSNLISYGSLYRCDLDGSNIEFLYRFSGQTAGSSSPWGLIDGAYPNYLMVGSDGNLYGTTQCGGYNVPNYELVPISPGVQFSGFGTFFKYDILSNTLTYLHRFSGSTSYQDGTNPVHVIEVNGNFYGTCSFGGYAIGTPPGSVLSFGLIFSCSSNGSYGILHKFLTGNDEGFEPYGIIYGNDGFLYGVNSNGGNIAGSRGVLYKSDLSGNITIIHRFSGQTYDDGFDPRSLLQASNNIIYGTTINGGTPNLGTIYSCDTSGNYGKIYNFNTATGSFPLVIFTEYLNSGIFYGPARFGGSNSKGVIYSANTSMNYGVLHNFGDLGTFGQLPAIPLIVSNTNGSLYGTTYFGTTTTDTLYSWISPCVFPFTPSGKTYVELFDPQYITYHYIWSNSINGDTIIYNFPFATKFSTYYWGNECQNSSLYLIREYNSQLDQNKDTPPILSRLITLPVIVGNPFRAYKGIAYYSTNLLYVINAANQRIDLIDITTNTGTFVSTVFSLPVPYQFDLTNRLTDSLYYDSNSSTFYIAFANVFASFDASGTMLNSGTPPSGNVVSMYIYNGNIYTNTDNNLIYLTTPGPSQTWAFTSLGIGPENGPMYGIAQSDSLCINTAFQPPIPPPPCIITATTVIGCSDFQIISYSGQNNTCYYDGSIYIAVSGGCPNYVYTLFDNSFNQISQVTASTTSWTFQNITNGGQYFLSATDCSGTTLTTISPITILNTETLFTNVYQLNNLEYCVVTTGGTSPYTIFVNGEIVADQVTGTTHCFTGTCSTNYNIVVRDSAVQPGNELFCLSFTDVSGSTSPFNQGGPLIGEVYYHSYDLVWPTRPIGSPLPILNPNFTNGLEPYSALTQPPIAYVTSSNFNVIDQLCYIGFPGLPSLVDFYQIEFYGCIKVPTTDTYIFKLGSDDGAVFSLPSISYTLDNDFGVQGYHSTIGSPVNLTSGIYYPLTMSYWQGPPYRIALQLYWSSSTIPYWTIVPTSAFGCSGSTIDNGCGCTATTIFNFSCETPTISISGTNVCCVNDGSVTLTINRGLPNYTITGTNLTTTEQIIFTSNTSPIFVNHLTQGIWNFNVLDGFGSSYSKNITLTAVTFDVNFYTASTSSTTGATYCFSVTSCTGNDTFVSLTNTNLSISQINSYQGIISANQQYCFNVPISECGENITLSISNGLNSGTTFYGSFADYADCLRWKTAGSSGGIQASEGTWINNHPAYWFSLEGSSPPFAGTFFTHDIVVYFDTTLNLWVWKDRTENVICSTSPDLSSWTTISSNQYCLCIDSFGFYSQVDNFYYPCNLEEYTVFVPCPALSLSATSTNPLCDQSCSGTITLTANGGTLPYTFQLRDVNNTVLNTITTTTNPYTFNNLCEGTYYPVVIDSLNASASTNSITIVNQFYVYTYVQSIDVTASTGVLCVQVSGGTNDYDITIRENTFPSFPVVVLSGNVSDGTYCFTLPNSTCYIITVDDNISLCYEGPVTCIPESLFSCYTITYIDPTCRCNGSVTITVPDVGSPYLYSLFSGTTLYTANSTFESYTFTGVCAGNWSTSVTLVNSNITVTCGSGFTLSNTLFLDFISASTCTNPGQYCVSLSGGVPPYTISFNGTQNISFVDGTFCYQADCGTGQLFIIDNSINYTEVSYDPLFNDTTAWNVIGGNNVIWQWFSGFIQMTIPNNGYASVDIVNYTTNFNIQNFNNLNSSTLFFNYEIEFNTLTTPVEVTFWDSYTFNNGNIGTFSLGNTSYTGSFVLTGINPSPQYQLGLIVNNGVAGDIVEITRFNLYVTYVDSCLFLENITIGCGVDLSATTVGNPCNQNGQGSITIGNIGGTPPYTYSINNGLNFYNQNYFPNLNSGTYDVVIKDKSGCTATTQVVVGFNTNVNVTATTTPENCDYSSGGTITVTANGGTPPYTYSFNGGTPSSQTYYTGLTVGTYTITVTDSVGCSTTITTTINPPISLSGTIVTSESCQYDPAITEYRALKVNNVWTFLGNISEEDKHIQYALCQGFNIFQMYGLYTVFGSGTLSNRLDIFLSKLYAKGLLPVAIMGGGTTGFNLVYNWETTPGRINKFWGVNKENEFWRYPASGTETFASWIASINYVNTTYPGRWNVGAYIANNASAFWGPTQADQIIAANIDVIECTNFITTYANGRPNPAVPSFLADDLQQLADAAQRAGVVQNFVPMWNSIGRHDLSGRTPTYQGPYFNLFSASTPPNLTQPINTYDIDYAATSFGNKNFVNKIGYCVFDYNSLISEIPYNPICSASTGTSVNLTSAKGSITINATGGYTPYQYSMDGGSFVTTNYFTDLSSGLHTYVILDASGCTVTGTSVVGTALSIDTTVTSLNCLSSGSGGTICVNVTNGYSPYTYSLNGGSYVSTNCFTGLTIGTYTIGVIDLSGCSATTIVEITAPTPISATTLVIDALSCINPNSGSIIVNPTGGSSPYDYSINNGLNYQTSNLFNNLSAGTYNILIVDALGCSGSTSAVIGTSSSFTITASGTSDNCIGSGIGTITINVIGGYSPYYYSTNGGLIFTGPINNNTYTQGGLTQGTYNVVVKDVSGCTASTQVVISTSENLTLNVVTTPENCFYNSGGTATVTVTGGTPLYTYSINGSTPTGSNYFSGLTVGTYSVVVTDSLGCNKSITFTINAPLLITGSTTSETCYYNSGGTVTVNVSSGTPPYTYSLDGGTFTSSNYFTGLTVGSHTIIVKDISGCSASTVTIVNPPILIGAIKTPENCFYSSGGTITALASSGIAPYTYYINGGGLTNSGFFSGLTVGTYTITAVDVSGCSATTAVTINAPIPVSATVITTNVSCFGGNNGTATVTANGGTPPYTYSINGGTYGTSSFFNNLSAGTYTLSVKDSYGCSATTTGIVSSATPVTVSAITTTGKTCYDSSFVTLSLIANGGTPPYTYLWKPINSTSQTINSSNYVTSAGTYSYSGTVIDRFGCSGSTVVNFTILASTAPILSISGTGILYCDGSQYPTLTATIIGSYDQIYWSNGQIGVLSISATTPGSYNYYVTVDGCLYVSDTIVIDYPQTIPPIIGYDAILCPCDSTTLSVLSNGYTYTDILWNTSQTGSTITVSSCTEGTFTYYITAKDQYGCAVTSNIVTVSYVGLEISLFKLDATYPTCSDGYARIDILSGEGPFTFNWSGTTSNSNIADNLIPGTYSVEVIDITGCRAFVIFEIDCLVPEECIYLPFRDLPVDGEDLGRITLNPDGTISFYNASISINDAQARTTKANCVPEECCILLSTPELPLEYCDCQCYWRTPDCTLQPYDKIILGGDGNNGVQLISQTREDNFTTVTCQYQASFKYLFNFDCEKILDCIDTNYNNDVLGFLSGLSASATVEVLSGGSYVTKQIVPIWKFNFYDQPTGVYFAGDLGKCEMLNQIIYAQLGFNCTALTETTFAAVWRTASFKLLDSLSGQTVKIGLILNNFNCEYNILLDELKIDEVCVITNEQILSDNSCPGFDLEKVIDNKKSWVYNESFYDRDWFHLKYRDTSYDDYDERLDINTKEVDLEIDIARAIEYDAYCYSQSTDCFIGNDCNFSELFIDTSPTGSPFDCFNNTSLAGLKLSYPTSGLTAGETYDLQFITKTTGPQGSTVYLSIGVETPGITGEIFILDLITGATNNGTAFFNYTITIPNNFPSYTNFFIRISSWTAPRKTYCINTNNISIKRNCEQNQVNPSNLGTTTSGMTFEEFREMIQNQLIDVKDRQSISDYPLLRYMFDKYLGLCGLNNCETQSGQYNYNTLNNFVGLLGDYWMDLVEQFVPATTIWKGGTRSYRNTVFDQDKFQYRNFQIGYCGDDCYLIGTQPPPPTICYIESSLIKTVNTLLTPNGFSDWVIENIMGGPLFPNVSGDILRSIRVCAGQNSQYGGLCDCVNIPDPCFVSANIKLSMTEGAITVNNSIPVTNLSNSPNRNDFLNLIYDSLTQLGYNTNTPLANGLEWSKISLVGCDDDIITNLTIDITYSCITGSTVIPSSGYSFNYQILKNDYPSQGQYNAGQLAFSGSMVYGVVKGIVGSLNIFGYLYSYNKVTTTFTILVTFGTIPNPLRNPSGALILGNDGWLYGTTIENNIPGTPNYNYGGLFRYNPITGQYQILANNFTTFGFPNGITNGSRMLYHSNGKIYFILIGGTSGSNIIELDITQPTPVTNWITNINNPTGEVFLSEDVANYLGGNYIFGVTSIGGVYNKGFIFRYDPLSTVGTVPTVVYDFGAVGTVVENPSGPLLQSTTSYNIFYGLSNGSVPNTQTLYSFDIIQAPLPTAVSAIHQFNGASPPEGRSPQGNLVLINNKIYGQTTTGTLTSSCGVVFEYNLSTSQYNIVYTYGGAGAGCNIVDSYPYLSYNSLDGYAYGVNPYGGNLKNGTLFRFGYSGTPATTLYNSGIFTCTNLQFLTDPIPVINKTTIVYSADPSTSTGTTINGVSNCTTSTSVGITTIITACTNTTLVSNYRVLHRFSGSTANPPDGRDPGFGQRLIQAPNGKLYGMTIFGGIPNIGCANNNGGGVVFELTTSGIYNVIHYFTGVTLSSLGINPQGNFTSNGGNILYGTTKAGFTYGTSNPPYSACVGTIFSLNTNTNNFNMLYPFSCAVGTTSPIIASDGKLYGYTSRSISCTQLGQAGPYAAGVYSSDTNGNFGMIFQITNPPFVDSGIYSSTYGTFMEASDGWLYGVLGANKLIRIKKDGTNFTVLHNFAGNGDVSVYGTDQLIEVNGKLYGVGYGGGNANNDGGLYTFDITSNQYQVIYVFNNPAVTGSKPMSKLLLKSDGFIYGVCSSGGNNNSGTIFKFDPNNLSNLQAIYYFNQGTSGYLPVGGVIEGTDGKLYGMTQNGGINNLGVIYSFDSFLSCTTISTSAITNYVTVNNTLTSNCPGYVNNPNVEVIVRDLTNISNNPCIEPPIIEQCNIIYATHIDDDVWFEGTVSVESITGSTNGGGVLITTNTNQL